MATSLSLRLAWAAFVVAAVPVVAPRLSRCAGQEPGRETYEARLAAVRKATAQVLAAEVRAELLVYTNLDEAMERLKTVRDSIRNDDALSDRTRDVLVASLERSMRSVLVRGVEIARREAERQVNRALLRARVDGWLAQVLQQLGLSPGSQ